MESTADKRAMYQLLQKQLEALTEGETELLPNLANFSALYYHALEQINWLGFYLVRNGELLLGPFQGQPACIHIPFDRGVCGAAARQRQTQRVQDVHAFPGHIACDAASRSELVIPLVVKNELVGVLDVDSPVVNRFDQADQEGMEAAAQALCRCCMEW